MILIIGPHGHIGKHVVSYFNENNQSYVKTTRRESLDTSSRYFDFNDHTTYTTALSGIKRVFFVRPPQIGDPKVFYPFIDYCKEINVEHIVFVSLLGIENNPIPPHAKIEKYIIRSGLNYTFLRPSFFMENLISPHGRDIVDKGEINIPARKSRTSFIACKDIGEVAAKVLMKPKEHINKSYSLTGSKALDYYEVAEIFSKIMNKKVVYTNPTFMRYTRGMISLGYDKDYIKVTKFLYLMTRLGTAKKVTDDVDLILERTPISMEEFVETHFKEWANI